MLGFPSFGVWGALLVWVDGAWPGVGPAGLLVRAVGEYLDPAENGDRYGPQIPAHGVLKFPGTVLVARVTSDLATCGSVQDMIAQGILDKIHHLVSVVGS